MLSKRGAAKIDEQYSSQFTHRKIAGLSDLNTTEDTNAQRFFRNTSGTEAVNTTKMCSGNNYFH
jgi:hypothetical protein